MALALISAFRPRRPYVTDFILSGEPFAAIAPRQDYFTVLVRGEKQSAEDFIAEVTDEAAAILDARWLEIATRVVQAPLLQRQLDEVSQNAVDVMLAMSDNRPNPVADKAHCHQDMLKIVDRLDAINTRLEQLEASQPHTCPPPLGKPKGNKRDGKPAR